MIQNPLNAYAWVFPVLICFHLAGIACGVGTAALMNLRLLGVGAAKKRTETLWSAAAFWKGTMPWTAAGLSLAITCGLLLFSSDPKEYLASEAFRFKIASLALAIVFYYTMVRQAAMSGARGAMTSIVACVSLGLWALVPFAGILIGSGSGIPVLLSLHILSLIVLGGMVVVTDLRFLGVALRNHPAAEVVNGLRVPKRVAFIAAALCGFVMFGADAARYLHDHSFWIKIALLALIAGNYWLFRRAGYDDLATRPITAKLAAGFSLVLWAGAIGAARGPATVKDVMHSMIDPSGDFLFQSVQTIADDQGVREKAPHTNAEWEEVRQRVTVLLEAPDLLEGRWAARPRDRSKNPQVENEPEEVQRLLDADPADFIRRARRLRDAAAVAMKAVHAKDKDVLAVALDRIDKACESCHLHYWYPKDKRAQQAAKEDGVIE